MCIKQSSMKSTSKYKKFLQVKSSYTPINKNQDFRDFFLDKVVSDTLDGRDDKLDDPCQMHGVQLFVKLCMNQLLVYILIIRFQIGKALIRFATVCLNYLTG